MLYDLILADCPWRYEFSSTDNRKIENQYPTMSTGDICKLKVPSKKNCVLYQWATAPKLEDAKLVMRAWGFTYKTHAVWDKEKMGMGYWFRGQHELLLVGTKGKISPPEPCFRMPSVLREKRTKHSKKPLIVYKHIEEWTAGKNFAKLEMFARKARKGWDCFGNEVDGVRLDGNESDISEDKIVRLRMLLENIDLLMQTNNVREALELAQGLVDV